MRIKVYFAAASIAALVAGLAQVASAEAGVSPPVATVQAEKMTSPVGASIVNDVTASGGYAVKMTAYGTSLTGRVSLPSSATSLSVIAKGTKNRRGWPQMSMEVDSKKMLPLTTVTYSDWHTYSVNISLAPGVHTLSMTYSNNNNSGRNLYADVINLYGSTTPAPVPTTTTPAPVPTTTPPAPVPTTTTPAPVPSATISSSYFGEHILGPVETNIGGSGVATAWPSWSPTTVRLWNTYGYDSSKGAYSGISWASLNTASGVYDWTLFDAVLAKHKAEGVTDLLYTFGYTPTWAGGGTNNDQAPSSNQYLATFTKAVAQRAIADGLPIRSWEVWNEPNNGVGTWTGTNAQMVAMAQTIYGAVKAVDPSYRVLTPSPQGNATSWMSSYLAAGGGAYADVMAFHGYTSSVPETIATLIDSYKNVFATYGQSGKPIWDTEAMDLTTSDPALQARFLAIYYLLHQAKGLDRLYWYAYDGDQGEEWFNTTGPDATATADVQVHSWMLGAVPGSLSKSGTIYSLPLTKGGQPTLAVWNSGGSSAYATGAYTHYTDLLGVQRSISGGTVNIGKDPVLLW
jgi:hypothetical protein